MGILNFLYLLGFIAAIQARISDRYCKSKNCYEILNITQDATPTDIKKSFRSLSLKYHPDKNPGKDTTPIYREINNAYEILSNPDVRATYDDYLANPDQNEYYQYYKFYKAVYAPQTDPKLVLGLFLSLFSLFQYVSRRSMYNTAMSHIEKTTKFQTLVNQRVQEEKDNKSGMTKEEIIAELRTTVNVHGGYSPPKIQELIIVKTLILPYSLGKWVYGCLRWVVMFWILRKPYGPEEREYLTRRMLGFNDRAWNMIPVEEKQGLIDSEIWIKENYAKYLKDAQEKERDMYGGSAKYKQYQRFMKKGTRYR